ncbi:MAG: hypothetical protein ACM31L_07855 [Actinomycetota bacterium]
MSKIQGHTGPDGVTAYAWGSLPAEILDDAEIYAVNASFRGLTTAEIAEDLIAMSNGRVNHVLAWRTSDEIHLAMG